VKTNETRTVRQSRARAKVTRDTASLPRRSGDEPTSINLDYYRTTNPGRTDYWRKMAAPRFRARTFIDLLKRENAASLADLGCGGGELLLEIGDHFHGMRLCGVDLSEAQIESNRAQHAAVEWIARDLEDPSPLPEALAGRFDVIVASEIIEHLGDPRRFLKTAAAMARPGSGKLLLSTQSGRVWETERRVGHRKHFSCEEVRRMLSESGWEPMQVWNAGFPFHDLSKRIANWSPSLTMRRFGENAYGPLENLACRGLGLAFMLNSGTRGSQLFAIGRNHV
jgi:2-polyprenyl-3-methyl-5-hydroxy-6-metoxy-1,4-benzoquinol methylase